VSYDDLDSSEAGPSPSCDNDGGSPKKSSIARILFAAKIAIGLTLCAVIVAKIDWQAASSSLAETGAGLVAVMFGILVALVFLSAYKWRLLLSIHGIEYSTLRLSRYYFVALFFNNFLPTSIGGDGYRIYKTMHNGRSRASAVIAVAMERLTGLGTLVALGVASAALLAVGKPVMLAIGVVAAACIGAAPIAWRMRSALPARFLAAVPEKVRSLVRTVAEHIDDYVRQPSRSIAVILISIVFHVGLAFAFYVLLRYGTDQEISMLQVIAVLAVTTFAAVLPISFNGLGVYEGTFIYLLAQYGVPPDVSIVPMILNRGLLIALSLVGAGLYLLDTASTVAGRAASADVVR